MFLIKKSLKHRFFKLITLGAPTCGKMIAKLIPEKKRNFHVFCVGLPRSGTHSIASLFRHKYRAAHEPYAGTTILLINELFKGKATKKQVTEQLIIRDSILQLELESSHYLYQLIPQLLKLFPESKFILTVREPRSWLESEINKNYKSIDGKMWSRLESLRYGRYENSYSNLSLEKMEGVYPVSTYLQYYIDHIDFVLENVPEQKLLVLDTFSLKKNIGRICEFTGAEMNLLNLSGIHSAKSTWKKIQLKHVLKVEKLDTLIDKYCKSYIENKLPMLTKYLK